MYFTHMTHAESHTHMHKPTNTHKHTHTHTCTHTTHQEDLPTHHDSDLPAQVREEVDHVWSGGRGTTEDQELGSVGVCM